MYLYQILGWLFAICFMPFFAFSQIHNKLRLPTPKPTPFDSLVAEINVPEIDPRQYIIIYEWKESNERRYREGIQDKSRIEQIKRYEALAKRSLNSIRLELDSLNKLINPTEAQQPNQMTSKLLTE